MLLYKPIKNFWKELCLGVIRLLISFQGEWTVLCELAFFIGYL